MSNSGNSFIDYFEQYANKVSCSSDEKSLKIPLKSLLSNNASVIFPSRGSAFVYVYRVHREGKIEAS